MLVTENLFFPNLSKWKAITKRKENAFNEQSLQNQLLITLVVHVNQK